MATIKDVARLTGLSISTISKYINGGNVLEQNRARIDAAIQALDYKVNQAARSLKTNRTMTVGILLPSLISFFAGITADIESRLLADGYNAVLLSYNNDPEQELAKLEFLIEQNVDGIILVPEGLTAGQLNAFRAIRENQIPLVLLDRWVEGFARDCVLVDNVGACQSAVEQFILRGHTRIGLITGPLTISTARERLEGYQNALAAHGVAPRESWIKVGDYSFQAGHALFHEFLDMPGRPSAILVVNFEMTLGAITAAHERKLKIPDDISFIGFDEVQLTRILNPPITIVLQPTGAMASRAAELLLKRMRGEMDGFPDAQRLKARLLVQESVALASRACP